jgi:putative nucleotidyltransferase with HDIG domain
MPSDRILAAREQAIPGITQGGNGLGNRLKEYLFTHFEMALVVVVFGSLLLIHSVVVHTFAFLLFYFIPVLMAGFFLSARHAVGTAVLCWLSSIYFTIMDPFGAAEADPSLTPWNLFIWGCFLTLTGALVGRLQDKNRIHTAQLRDAYRGILQILVKYLEAADDYTKTHSERVASVSVILARRLGLAPGEVQNVWSAALLHDIGKIEVIELIRKEAALTVEEKAQVDAHTELGARLILTTGSVLNDVIPLVLDHHRPFADGGNAIPIGARIISVADTYDAVLTDRPYRAGRMHWQAVEILQEAAGRQFDPKVVEALKGAETEVLSVYREMPAAIEVTSLPF